MGQVDETIQPAPPGLRIAQRQPVSLDAVPHPVNIQGHCPGQPIDNIEILFLYSRANFTREAPNPQECRFAWYPDLVLPGPCRDILDTLRKEVYLVTIGHKRACKVAGEPFQATVRGGEPVVDQGNFHLFRMTTTCDLSNIAVVFNIKKANPNFATGSICSDQITCFVNGFKFGPELVYLD